MLFSVVGKVSGDNLHPPDTTENILGSDSIMNNKFQRKSRISSQFRPKSICNFNHYTHMTHIILSTYINFLLERLQSSNVLNAEKETVAKVAGSKSTMFTLHIEATNKRTEYT